MFYGYFTAKILNLLIFMQPILKVISYVLLYLLLTNFSCSVTKSIVYASQKDVLVKNGSYIGTESVKNDPCKNALNYQPDIANPEFVPVKYIKVSVHFIDHPNRKYNFGEKEGTIYARDLIAHANQKLLKNNKMHLPKDNETPVLPIRIQYVLTPDPKKPNDEGIYFHQDPEIWYLNKKEKRGVHGLYSDAVYDKFGVQKEKVLNIFMMEHHPDSLLSETYKNASNGIGKSYYAKISNSYYDYKQTKAGKASKGTWFVANTLNHEIGHSLGLLHSWTRNDGCEDTPIHSNCWGETEKPPCDGIISNNMMDYNRYSNAVTPCQIAKMHYNMSKDKSSQRKISRQDWCVYHPDKTITIGKGQKVEWPCNKDVLGDIIVQQDAELVIHCSLSMPVNSRIKLYPGAQLIVNDGKIFSRCNTTWKGIELVKQSGSEPGKIIMYGKAAILQASNGYSNTLIPN